MRCVCVWGGGLRDGQNHAGRVVVVIRVESSNVRVAIRVRVQVAPKARVSMPTMVEAAAMNDIPKAKPRSYFSLPPDELLGACACECA
jgi:hypothetical protein